MKERDCLIAQRYSRQAAGCTFNEVNNFLGVALLGSSYQKS